MTLTLRAAISAAQTTFDVLGSDDLQRRSIVQIDAEYAEVRTANPATLGFGESARYQVSVTRGVLGSTAAAHAAGATVTPVQIVVQTDAPSAPPPGAAQQVSLLGPFHVAFDTPGLATANGIVALDLPAGSIVIRAWAFITTDFVDGAQTLRLGVGTTADVGADTWQQTLAYTGSLFTTGLAYFVEPATADDVIASPGPVAGHVFVKMTGDPATVGEADIYALIATAA